MIKVIDELLPNIFYKNLKNLLNQGNNFPWFWDFRTASDNKGNALDNNFMFTHMLFTNDFKSHFFEAFYPFVYFLNKHVPIKKLIRMKLNLYTNQNKKIIHAKHNDSTDANGIVVEGLNVTVFNFNTCNGGTIINDKEYLSKENQAIIFDNKFMHQGFTQTDNSRRIVLNIVTG